MLVPQLLPRERCRVGLQSEASSDASLRPKLPHKTETAFRAFVGRANRSALHPLDWRRFYKFVHAATTYRANLEDHQVAHLLYAEGFEWKKCEQLARVFHHGREILSLYFKGQ